MTATGTARPELVVTGIGAVTPVGLSAPASCAALRASVSRLAALECWAIDGRWETPDGVLGGRVPLEWFDGGPVEEEWPGHRRFKVRPPAPPHLRIASGSARVVELARHASAEACQQAGLRARRPASVGLYLGLDDAEDPDPPLDELCLAHGIQTSRAWVGRAGRAAGLVALHRAAHDLGAGKVSCAIVGGADSLIRRERVDRLEEEGRLKTDRTPYGALPGEAAAFLVVETVAAARERAAAVLARLCSTGAAEEPTAGTNQPSQGAGLTQALRDALGPAGSAPSRPLVVCDLNGDRYRALEWGLVNTRLAHGLRGFAGVWHPADCIGDSGAASGVLSVVWAVTAVRKGYARSDSVLVWGASDGKARAAAVLATAPTPS